MVKNPAFGAWYSDDDPEDERGIRPKKGVYFESSDTENEVIQKENKAENPLMNILRLIVLDLKKNKKPINKDSLCDAVEEYGEIPDLADKVTTKMIDHILLEYKLDLISEERDL